MSLIQKVAIFGAAGAIGQAVAAEFERRAIPFRVVGRGKAKLQAAFGSMQHAEIFDADLTELRSAGAAARGVDTIVYAVGVPYPSFQLHPAMMRTTIEAAATMQVARLVLVSNVYTYGVPRTSHVAETHAREPQTRKGNFRKEQEDAVLEAHRQGRVQGMVVRLPDFYGPNADLSMANPIFRAALAGQTANWLGPVNAPHEFLYVPDAGPAIADLADCARCYGEAWNVAGAGELNAMDFITRVYRAAGRSPKYRSVGRGLLKMMGWFSPLYRELPEMLYLTETPVLLDDSKLRAQFPALHKTSYDEGIRQTIAWMRK
ncbi:MAG TPA: NAD-dependent epimerase/dehydratase family protein [Bryobacteraceae bacterium]|jgi:nucleoside-diphosphate-sugar epimerase|nr:NAD-dependent epimerase/dehydratase family protein [Bryobacteraceae bacterium]